MQPLLELSKDRKGQGFPLPPTLQNHYSAPSRGPGSLVLWSRAHAGQAGAEGAEQEEGQVEGPACLALQLQWLGLKEPTHLDLVLPNQ